MKIITSRQAYDKYNELLQYCIQQLNQFTQGKVIYLGENGFEDMSHNDICGLDDNYVYFNNFEDNYSLHELDVLDAIKIVGDLEETKKFKYAKLPA